jgi:hypothetical protein
MCAAWLAGVATLRGTLPWIAPEIIKTPSSVTESVVSPIADDTSQPHTAFILISAIRECYQAPSKEVPCPRAVIRSLQCYVLINSSTNCNGAVCCMPRGIF